MNGSIILKTLGSIKQLTGILITCSILSKAGLLWKPAGQTYYGKASHTLMMWKATKAAENRSCICSGVRSAFLRNTYALEG